MAYVALYRAYRPQKFSEVVGQRHIVTTLQNAIRLNKVAHAYLFSGPRGTGKTTIAKILAKALNCESGPTIEPCGTCFLCEGITKGTIPDVVELDAASNNGADDIRVIRDSVKFMPSVARYKVYIIDEVHMLSNAAFNALLKTLEEPPKHVIFILATTEPYKLPATILSRCQRFDFQAITDNEIFNRLNVVCKSENINSTEEALGLIAQSAEGGMRDALSLLDACISYSTDDVVDINDVLAVSGNVSSELLLEIINSAYLKNGGTILKLLNDILADGKEIPRLVNDLILFLRDTLLYKNNSLNSLKSIYQAAKFIELAGQISSNLIYSYLDVLNELQNNIRYTNQKRPYMEVALLKMCDAMNQAPEVIVKEIQSSPSNVAKPKTTYNPGELKETIEKPKEVIVPKAIENQNEEVQIEQIENILNNPNKTKKEFLIDYFNSLQRKYTSDIALNMLCQGKIVAASSKDVLVVLKDEGLCNRVMRYESFVNIMSKINKEQNIIEDYIAIPQAIWNSIINDFMEKYKNGVTKPKLEPIRIPVKNHLKPKEQANPELDLAYELFDKDLVKII